MILSDRDIKKLGRNVIAPFKEENVQPNSIDLTLGNEYYSEDMGVVRAQKIILPVDGFILATTDERIRLPSNLMGRVDGKSSLGRIGLQVHSTAGFIDRGFVGQITLELKNIGNKPITLYKGAKICQLSFDMVSSGDKEYGECGNHYQNQHGVIKSCIELVNGCYHVTGTPLDESQTSLDRFKTCCNAK